jgi:hypothetical protein
MRTKIIMTKELKVLVVMHLTALLNLKKMKTKIVI